MNRVWAAWVRRSPDGRNIVQAVLRKVRTPQGNAPRESEGRKPRGDRMDSATESKPPMARKGTGKGETVE